MTAPELPPAAVSAHPGPRPGRGLRIALGLSLAVNLLVLGLVGGAVLHGPPSRFHDGRDMSFGPFAEALRPEDRKALRRDILQRAPELRAGREKRQQEIEGLLQALRAEPFDAARLESVMAAQQAQLASQLALGAAVIRDYLIALPLEERLAFADRLEASLRRGPGGDKAEKATPPAQD